MSSRATTTSKASYRSRISNGSALFASADGRSASSRRFRDLIAAHAADLGGVDQCSEAKLSIVRRAAALEVALEQMEETIADKPEAFDVGTYTTAANSLRRLLADIGLERIPRDVGHSPLVEHFARRPVTEAAE